MPYHMSLHISLNAEHCPFRLQVEQFHVIIYPSLPAPTPPQPLSHFYFTSCYAPDASDVQTISICPALPPQPHSVNTQKTIQEYMTSYPHIHLTIIRSALCRLCRFSASIHCPWFQYHMSTHWTWALVLYIFPYMWFDKGYRGGNSTTSEEVFRFQHLFP